MTTQPYDFDESTSEAGGNADPAQYDGEGSDPHLAETGVVYAPDEPTDEELDAAEAGLDADSEMQ